jgi:hypothetical protein
MEYLIDPFKPNLADPPDGGDGKMEPSTPEVDTASSWPQYYPLYGVFLPFDDER